MKSYAPSSTRDIVTKYFTSLGERNLEKTLEFFAENIELNIPGNEIRAPWLGERSTKAEVEKFYKLLWKNTEAISTGPPRNVCTS